MNNQLLAIFQKHPRLWSWIADLIFAIVMASLVASVLGIGFLNSANWPTGGDAASHLLYAQLYSDDLLFSGKVVPWVPEVFGGLPFLSYYFPLPFMVIAFLSKVMGLAPAFKWGGFLASMLLPGAVFTASRRWLGFSWQAACFGAFGALAYLLHEQNSIWGGNLLSTLSGEFAYSYGILFAVLAMMAWARAIHLGRGWVLAAVMEAASGFSHGFPLLIVGFSTGFLLLDGLSGGKERMLQHFKQSLRMLLCGHALAFALLGGWLWPMLEMHSLTIPNDASFGVSGWRDLFPVTLWPLGWAGLAGVLLLALPSVRRGWNEQQRRAVCYFASAAGLAAVAFIAGDQLGLADIRFFPLVWLLGAIACGWLAGQALAFIGVSANGKRPVPRFLVAASACLAMLGWIGPEIQRAPDWGLWNHSGLDPKPQWHNLKQLFPAMQGDLWTPRMTFEHDPANSDLGSTRTLEALPMFLGHRPVLEGLYMESALLGPAVYQLQSEISAQPSSPLVRFPSGSLDPELAAKHMNFLHADTALLRSDKAKAALEGSGLFVKMAESPPFALYRLKQFDSRLAQVVTQPLRLIPGKDWMQDAFAWFRNRNRFAAYLPVVGTALPPVGKVPAAPVREVKLDRHELVFETSAVGQPHLIKVAYHPRWHLASNGSLHIAGPGYMLVVPQEKEIRLVYGHTLVGKLGIAATLSAAAILLFLLWRNLKRATPAAEDRAAPASALHRWAPVVIGWLMLIVAGLFFLSRSPERVYTEAWVLMNAAQHAQASKEFLRAYQLRRPPAKKEEALFWMAKAAELAGQRAEAKARYRELIELFHGYWVPESLYTYATLEELDNNHAAAAPIWQRLREDYPNSPWNLRHEGK
ncbi:MAG: hypothetical protein HYS18_06740 [Burkholderiales bacterium]|nr:hypothetical protein [Burkholderiales bacterium]